MADIELREDKKLQIDPYSVRNIGQSDGTQDIELLVDGTVVDSAADLTVAAGDTTTGVLETNVFGNSDVGNVYPVKLQSQNSQDVIDLKIISAIPDSVVSRDPDDNVGNNSNDVGIVFSTSQEWPDFQAKISTNTVTNSDEEMVIGDTNGNDIAVTDISGNSAGDVITFSGVNLSANTTYSIHTRSAYKRDHGYDGDPSFPYTSDGNLEITDGWFQGSTDSFPRAIVQIGNINL